MSLDMEEVSGTSMFSDSAAYKGRYCKSGYMKLSPGHDEAMPSLSPQLMPRQDSQLEQDVKAPFTMQFDQDGWQSMKHKASKLENTRNSPLEAGCSSDTENGSFKRRLVIAGRLVQDEDMDGNSVLSQNGDDCYKSDNVNDDGVRPRTFSDSRRTPLVESRDGVHPDMVDGRYLANFGIAEALPRYRKYTNSPAKTGDAGGMPDRRKDFDVPFASPAMKKFPGNTSLDDNALAAMLQKYAVSNGSDGYRMSPLKTSGARYSLNGMPEKRHFHQEMLHPPAVSYGLPGMQGPGVDLGGLEKGPSHHDVFCCHLCSFMGTSEEDFQMHLASHYDYQCPHPNCTYSSRTEGRLKRHIRDFHSDVEAVMDPQMDGAGSPHTPKTNQPKRFKCRQCKFISYSREEHWTHNRTHIKEEKQLQCPRCPFVTEFKHHLEYHIRNHVGSKPFKCNKCNYSCVNKSMLNSHMKSHTNVYQFRCANCKYATKYSHSLKLHLLKKKHQPAVVLNPDGSLPTDGSGNFELVSKRGPPRGPRGPRKSKQPMESVSPPALLPIFPASSASNTPFSQGNDYSWVQTQGGKPPNRVAISTSLPPINVSMFPGAGTMAGQSLAYPLSMLSHLSSTVAPSLVGSFYHPERMPSATTNSTQPFKCSFCRACYQSIPLLAQHVKLEHADKLSNFGIKLEAKSPLQEPTSTDADRYHLSEMQLDAGGSSKDAVEHLLTSHSRPETGRGLRTSAGEASASKSTEDHSEQGHLRCLKTVQKNSDQDGGEFPLDLSARQNGDVKKKATKRSLDEANEDADLVHQCPTVSPSSAGSLAVISRKRSRKGKACKLDVISLKLQDRWVEDECQAEEEESSFDSDCQQLGSDSNNEMERPFSEVGCRALSPPEKNWNDGNTWGWRKESPQPSDVVVDGDHRDGEKVKHHGNSDQEPVCDSLSNDSMGKTSESFTVRANMEKPVRKPADKGYFMCQHCEMGFRDCVTYTLHMGYHGYNDPFQCNMCGHRSEDPVGFFVHIARVAHE